MTQPVVQTVQEHVTVTVSGGSAVGVFAGADAAVAVRPGGSSSVGVTPQPGTTVEVGSGTGPAGPQGPPGVAGPQNVYVGPTPPASLTPSGAWFQTDATTGELLEIWTGTLP